jgi:hypothetical protein
MQFRRYEPLILSYPIVRLKFFWRFLSVVNHSETVIGDAQNDVKGLTWGEKSAIFSRISIILKNFI